MPIPTAASEILTACMDAMRRQMISNNVLAHQTGCLPADVAAPSPERQRAIRLLREALGLPQDLGVLRKWLAGKPTPDTIQRALERARAMAEARP